MKYMFYFENGYFEISKYQNGYILIMATQTEQQRLGYYTSPGQAADDVANAIDIEFPPIDDAIIHRLPNDLDDFEIIR